MLHWLIARGIEPHIPLLNGSGVTNGLFTRTDFVYDAEANVLTCPNGKPLKSNGLVRDGGYVPYWASTKDCRVCVSVETAMHGGCQAHRHSQYI